MGLSFIKTCASGAGPQRDAHCSRTRTAETVPSIAGCSTRSRRRRTRCIGPRSMSNRLLARKRWEQRRHVREFRRILQECGPGPVGLGVVSLMAALMATQPRTKRQRPRHG